MKELSIEEKAKRYDEAIERAKEFKNNPFAGYDSTDLISSLFPELKESEDEKIRKWIIDYFKENNAALAFSGISNESVIAWLEKRAEELTWEDISDIIEIHEDVLEMESCENVYMEVLKRFKAQKK